MNTYCIYNKDYETINYTKHNTMQLAAHLTLTFDICMMKQIYYYYYYLELHAKSQQPTHPCHSLRNPYDTHTQETNYI